MPCDVLIKTKGIQLKFCIKKDDSGSSSLEYSFPLVKSILLKYGYSVQIFV